MSHPKLDISHLLESTSDVAFVSACYQTLLERTINPNEIRYAIQMLKNGLSKKGFIYWICHSPEFGNRYSVKNLSSYCLACYFYKGYEKMQKILHLTRIKKTKHGTLPPQSTLSDFGFCISELPPESFDFQTEFSALSCGQISLISSLLHTETRQKHWTLSGHLASEIMPNDSNFSTITPEKHINDIQNYTDNTLITSPGVIFKLLTDKTLCHATKYIKSTLIFTMPVLPSTNQLSIIWNENWSSYENTDGLYSRWLKGSYNQSIITIINHSTDYKKVSTSFLLMCPYPGALISMKYAGKSIDITMKETMCHISLEMWLNPGSNQLTFHYSGTHYVPEGDWSIAAKFAVAKLTLYETNDNENKISNLEAYELSEEDLGSGYYHYLLTDTFVRTQLHRNGFFEVQAYSISSTYAIDKLMTTRYYYPADERALNCYYIFEHSDFINNHDKFPALNVYIAHRTSPFKRETYSCL